MKKKLFAALALFLWLAIVLSLRMIYGYSLEIVFILGLIGLLLIFLYSDTIHTTPKFRVFLTYIVIVEFIAFSLMLGSKFVSGLQNEYFFSGFFTLESFIPSPYEGEVNSIIAVTGSDTLLSAMSTLFGIVFEILTIPALIFSGTPISEKTFKEFIQQNRTFDQEKRLRISTLPGKNVISYTPSTTNGVELTIPISGGVDETKFSQFTLRGGNVLATTPSGAFLLSMLEDSNAVRLPERKEELFPCIEDIYRSVLETAETVQVKEKGNTLQLEFRKWNTTPMYAQNREFLFNTDLYYPGALFSLFVCMAVKGLRKPYSVDRISLDEGTGTSIVTIK